jgi:hypothetical protein
MPPTSKNVRLFILVKPVVALTSDLEALWNMAFGCLQATECQAVAAC